MRTYSIKQSPFSIKLCRSGTEICEIEGGDGGREERKKKIRGVIGEGVALSGAPISFLCPRKKKEKKEMAQNDCDEIRERDNFAFPLKIKAKESHLEC